MSSAARSTRRRAGSCTPTTFRGADRAVAGMLEGPDPLVLCSTVLSKQAAIVMCASYGWQDGCSVSRPHISIATDRRKKGRMVKRPKGACQAKSLLETASVDFCLFFLVRTGLRRPPLGQERERAVDEGSLIQPTPAATLHCGKSREPGPVPA